MKYRQICESLKANPKTWLVTGVAGFIGGHLLEELLSLGQKVIGVDNFSTGTKVNLDRISADSVNFSFSEGDIADAKTCAALFQNRQIDYVLHQAALGSVPRSIQDPLNSHRSNVDGFINILISARDAKVKKFVYASSSSVYGDSEESPKREERIGEPLSPYAATKKTNEIYAAVFARNYEIETVGLRYFNVFGPRQNPEGPYAAVIPRWINSMLLGEHCKIFGDGSTSRDFCFVKNVVQANILAATCSLKGSSVLNIAAGATTSLVQLYELLRMAIMTNKPELKIPEKPIFEPFRKGDIMHSFADISRAKDQLGYEPTHTVRQGIDQLVGSW